jgi:hypothetical protein
VSGSPEAGHSDASFKIAFVQRSSAFLAEPLQFRRSLGQDTLVTVQLTVGLHGFASRARDVGKDVRRASDYVMLDDRADRVSRSLC